MTQPKEIPLGEQKQMADAQAAELTMHHGPEGMRSVYAREWWGVFVDGTDEEPLAVSFSRELAAWIASSNSPALFVGAPRRNLIVRSVRVARAAWRV